MYNTKFILSNGEEIYPGYLDKDRRIELKEEYGNDREYMWCGCSINGKKLYYRISEDLKIYPEHNNYVHDRYCSRFRTETGEEERKTGYVVNEEDGAVTAYLTFNPKNLELGEKAEKEEENPELTQEELEKSEDEAVIEKENITKKEEKKEPKLSLASLIRSINIDTYTERIMNDSRINSKESFSKLVYFRMKKVRASRMKKSIGELSLETDGVRFIYAPFAGAIKNESNGLIKCYMSNLGPEGKVFNNFIFPDTMNKAIKEFVKMYGIEPNTDTMLAGFQYYKKTKSGAQYKVLGRVHLFQVSNLGIYCRRLIEKEAYDSICKITDENKDIKFWIPPDDESIGGIIQVKDKKKKLLLLFRSNKDERIAFNESIYEPVVVGEGQSLSKEYLYNLFERLE